MLLCVMRENSDGRRHRIEKQCIGMILQNYWQGPTLALLGSGASLDQVMFGGDAPWLKKKTPLSRGLFYSGG